MKIKLPGPVNLWLAPALIALLGGCSTISSLSVRHSPLYYGQAHVITVKATASDPAGIDKIAFKIFSGTMTACTEYGGPPSGVPCRENVVQQFALPCSFPAHPTHATCETTVSGSDQSLITYSAQAWNTKGSVLNTDEIETSGGAPLTQTTYGGQTIAWTLAVPIFVHTKSLSGADQINLGFYPNQDYAQRPWLINGAFRDDVNDIIEHAFFNDADNFAQTYSGTIAVFNLWAGPDGAQVTPHIAGAIPNDPANSCDTPLFMFPSIGSGLLSASAVITANAVLHIADCRDNSGVKSYHQFKTTVEGHSSGVVGDSGWVLTHESGHLIYGLADEYGCDGGYPKVSTPHNVFSSEADCKAELTNQNIIAVSPTAKCAKITDDSNTMIPQANRPVCAMKTSGFGQFRVDDGTLETMKDRIATSSWRNLSRIAVGKTIANCVSGNCFPP